MNNFTWSMIQLPPASNPWREVEADFGMREVRKRKENQLSFTSQISIALTPTGFIPESERMAKLPPLLIISALSILHLSASAAERVHAFTKIHPTDKFWAEGANFADFN